MIKILIDNPMLLLFAVIAVGYPIGRIKIRGVNLGLSAVLFVGIAVGALHPDLKLPEIVYVLGLVLFVGIYQYEQQQRINQYERGTVLLAECLKLAAVSDRKAIENRLLLPPS